MINVSTIPCIPAAPLLGPVALPTLETTFEVVEPVAAPVVGEVLSVIDGYPSVLFPGNRAAYREEGAWRFWGMYWNIRRILRGFKLAFGRR